MQQQRRPFTASKYKLRTGSYFFLIELSVETFGCSAMSAKKKDFEERVVIFKKESGQSKEDAWLYFDTKVTGAANNLHTDQAPFIFEQFDDKLPDWGLK